MTLSKLAFAAIVSMPILATSPALACPSQVTISHGDTLSAIAAACGVNVETLMQANPGLRPNRLQAGMNIEVPDAGARSRQIPYNRPRVTVAPPIAQTGPGIQTQTNIPLREFRRERPVYFDPTRPPLPGEVPIAGQPSTPGWPLPQR
ncbi:MAG: LysM peptidoglycan-binding domain-containing protein [Aliihoeflea sp.]